MKRRNPLGLFSLFTMCIGPQGCDDAGQLPPERGVSGKGAGKHIIVAAMLAMLGLPMSMGCATGDSDELEDVDQASQEIIGCDYTTNPPDATRTGTYWTATSLGDSYSNAFCTAYVVEFTAKDQIGFFWDHSVNTEAECNRLRTTATSYTYWLGSWTTNGMNKRHGVWGLGSCQMVDDSGYEPLSFGLGTKWRVAVSAYEQNCTDTCYTDYHRVSVQSYQNPD